MDDSENIENDQNVKPKKSKKSEPEIEFVPEDPKFEFNDLILPKSTEEQLLDVSTYAENFNQVFNIWGFSKTHKYSKRIGVNLYGPPGTGKTMAAHAIAKKLNKKILIINYADIESKYVGETPKNIRKAFQTAKESSSILFFDEADAILSRRVTNMTQAVDVSVNQTRSVMLMLMNEYQDFIIFATNFIENFDPAFMRRISVHIKFDLPDSECRKKLWCKYIPENLPHNLDIEMLANVYDGISGSDISNCILTAAFKSARTNKDHLENEYVKEALKNIIDSKNANNKNKVIVSKKQVSEDYVKKQLGHSNVEEIKES
ncbi:MAG: ATP-binding protein [Treponema sp.]|nr:ATP-binding protein [Treponema sp.]